jgi:hypothetical protein
MNTFFARLSLVVMSWIIVLLVFLLAHPLVYLASMLRPSGAEQEAAQISVGMHLWQVKEAIRGSLWVCDGKCTPRRYGWDASTLIIEFSEAPHQVVAVHTYRPGFRFWLLMLYPSARDYIPILNPPYDPVQRAARPLRPRTDLPPECR